MLYRIAFLLVAFCSGIAFGQVELSGNNSNKLLWVRAVTNMAPGAAFYLASDERSVFTATYGNPNQPYIPASLDLLTRKFDTNGSIDRLWGNLVTLSDGGLVKQPVRIDDEYETARILGDVHSRWVIRSNGRTTPIPTRFIATRRNTLFAVGVVGAAVGVGEESIIELDGYRPNIRIGKIGEFPPMRFEGPPVGFASDGMAVVFADVVNGVARKDSFYLADTKSLVLGRLFSWDPRWQRFIWPNNSGRTPVVSTPDGKIIVSVLRDPGGNKTTNGLAVIDSKTQASRIIEFPFGPLAITGMAVGRDRFVYCSLSDRSHSSGPNFQGGIAKVNLETGNVEMIGIVTNSVEVPPIITKAGVLLVSSLGTLRSGTGTIHAIQTESVGGLAKSPWPRSTGDNFDSYREQAVDDSDEIGVPDTIPSPHVAILVQPQPQVTRAGDSVTLTVVATNANSFQWIKDGVWIKGATNSTLVINNASDSDSGQYRVIASVGAAPFVQEPLLSNLMAKDLFALRYWVQNVSFYEGNNSQYSRYFVPRSLGSDGRIVGEYQDNRINRGQAAVTGPNGVGLVKLEKLLGGQRSVATSINERNQIVGFVQSDAQGQAFLESFIINEDWLSFEKLKTPKNGQLIVASSINTSGLVVGFYGGGQKNQPFIMGQNGVEITGLGGFRDDFEGDAVAINNQGQVVGWSRIQPRDEQRAFITGTNGFGMRDLGILGGSEIQGSNSFATAVNNLGQVVGSSSLNGGDIHAFITEPNGGKMRGLGTLGGISSHAYDINDTGQVVGWSYTNLVSSPVSHAFVTGKNGSGMFDLNSFVQLEGGAQLETADSINNRGQILAHGGGRSYLLTPTAVISRIATITIDCPSQDLQKGLIAYYPLDGNGEDKSGNGRFGVVNGPKPAQDRFGNLDGSLSFNGKTDYVLINKKFPDLTGLSFSAWIFYEGGSSLGRGDIFSDSTIDGGNDFQVAVISGSRIGIVANKNGSKLAREIELPYSIKSKWTHIVWAMSGVEQTVYINGLKISTLNEGGQNVGFHSQATIGASNSEDPLISFFQGRIDEVRVYDRPLSECEVQSLYAFESEMPYKLNRAPTLNALADVKLLQNAPIQTVNLNGIGSGAVDELQVLTVTATSDNPGLIPNPAVTYTSPNAVGSLSYQPVAGVTGKAMITVTVKDDGGGLNGGQDTFSRQFLVDVAKVDNKAPEVIIVSPVDGSISTVDSPINLVAEAKDLDGTISKVEFFYINNQSIGTVSSPPYQITVSNLVEGKYSFYAKATDNSGLSTISSVVGVTVLGERRDVAVIKVSLDPKLDILTQYISEVQLSGQQESLTWKTFERSDISFEVLARYRVVVWNDPHPASKMLKNEIGLLKRLLQSGVTVYSIGPKLATAADGLDATDKTDWRSIVNISSIGKTAEMGQVELIGEEDHGPILDGMYGTVEAFKTSGTVDGGTASASADSSGKSAGCDVYVSFPSVSLPDSALARRFSQLIPLAENGDEFSIEERKKVFKNAICWLLDCNRCAVINLTLLTEETLIEPAVPQTGEQFVLKLQFTQNAECPATGVRVKVEVPPGLTVLGATTEQGEVSHGATEANFSLGRLGVHKVVPVELKLRSQIGGIVTNNITFYANGLTSTSIVAFHHETAFTISGDSVPMISADRDVTGNVRLKVGGQLGATYVIEKSVAIAGNGQIQWATLKEFQLVASEYVHVHVIDATTSSAMFRVRKR